MTIANILLCLVVLTAIGATIFYTIKKKREAPTEETLNVDDKTDTREKMQDMI